MTMNQVGTVPDRPDVETVVRYIRFAV